MEKQKIIQLIREGINRFKEIGVPELMMEPKPKNIEKLKKIVADTDYSALESEQNPKITPKALGLSGEDDALASVLFIWGNPKWRAGDFNVFEDFEDYQEFLLNEGGEMGKKIANIQYEYPISINEITLEQLLGLEAIED